MDPGLLLAIGSALVSAAFSAGMAAMSIRVIGKAVDELRQDVTRRMDHADLQHDEQGATIARHDTRITVVEDRTARIERRVSPWEGTKRQ